MVAGSSPATVKSVYWIFIFEKRNKKNIKKVFLNKRKKVFLNKRKKVFLNKRKKVFLNKRKTNDK